MGGKGAWVTAALGNAFVEFWACCVTRVPPSLSSCSIYALCLRAIKGSRLQCTYIEPVQTQKHLPTRNSSKYNAHDHIKPRMTPK